MQHFVQSQTQLFVHHRDRILIVFMTICVLGVIGIATPGYECGLLKWALQIELSGGSAYGPEMQERFNQTFPPPLSNAGFAYPLPSMWLAIPALLLPDVLEQAVWSILNIGLILVGIKLLRMPLQLIFFAPILLATYIQQSTALLIGLLLIAIWAQRERRWWLLGILIALTIGAKPQVTLLTASALAILSFRDGGWRPVIICNVVVQGLTLLFEPMWIFEWLAAVERFRLYISPNWMPWWLAIALVMVVLRQFWGALALFQVGLFPTIFGYMLLPVLLGYVDQRTHRFAWLAVACSWMMVVLADREPLWLLTSIFYFTPLLLSAVWSVRQTQNSSHL
ncbi:MAG: hypothetical protein GFH27_549283n351 [Chloroflexi bacterium AL-W]|nr:hypothetical protein [Chloroflexi bacterium AL-N1]NOK64527.1 hypothetical protein [Chloroflexi bacterium AL-N10]NOK75769.1 hypothetical protein [Chloroflexi bacterium AL-N5]NOK80472.1 hypothetical protein [Chloroflexi bacterium AL-W]NOK86986.1 hypothetical protein [Chloroflexi bacterium AL-N15]